MKILIKIIILLYITSIINGQGLCTNGTDLVEDTDPSVCSGQGLCLNSTGTGYVCECNINHEGIACNITKHQCYGINYDGPNVCGKLDGVENEGNFNGECIQLGNNSTRCACKNEWHGENCDEWQCFGIYSDDINVCSSNGTCTSSDKCICANENIEGRNCNITKHQCYGINYDLDNVCSNNGECPDENHCLCDPDYEGLECQTKKHQCYGINYDWQNVCNSFGTCTSNDTCVCNTGGYGDQCEHFHVCYNRDCNNGTCIEDRSDDYAFTCDCNFEYNTFGAVADYCTKEIDFVDSVCIRDADYATGTLSYLGAIAGTGGAETTYGQDRCRGWERWDIIPAGDGYVFLRNHEHGTYFSVRSTFTTQMRASPSTWEKFNITQVGLDGSQNLYTIVSWHGSYIYVNMVANQWESNGTYTEMEISSTTSQYRITDNNMRCRQDNAERGSCVCGVGEHDGHCADPDVQTIGVCLGHIDSGKFLAPTIQADYHQLPAGITSTDSCTATGMGGWHLIKTNGNVVIANNIRAMVLGSESGTDQLWSMNTGSASTSEQFKFTYLGSNEYYIQDNAGEYLYWDATNSLFKTSLSNPEKWTVEDFSTP